MSTVKIYVLVLYSTELTWRHSAVQISVACSRCDICTALYISVHKIWNLLMRTWKGTLHAVNVADITSMDVD